MQEIIDKAYGYLLQYGMSVVAAILIVIIGKWVAKLLVKIAERLMSKTKLNKTLILFAKNILLRSHPRPIKRGEAGFMQPHHLCILIEWGISAPL